MTRPEGPLFLFIATLFKVKHFYTDKALTKVFYQWATFILITFGLYFAWRYGYYGYVFPNTFYAKTGGGTHKIVLGFQYVYDFYLSQGLNIIFHITGLVFLLYTYLVAKLLKQKLLVIILIYVFYISFIIYAGGDWMAGYRFFSQIFPIFAVVAGVGSSYFYKSIKSKLVYNLFHRKKLY